MTYILYTKIFWCFLKYNMFLDAWTFILIQNRLYIVSLLVTLSLGKACAGNMLKTKCKYGGGF